MLLVHGVSEDGQRWDVLRKRGDQVEAGAVQPVREGQPLTGELVKLTPREDAQAPLFDVEVQYDARPKGAPAPRSERKAQATAEPGPAPLPIEAAEAARHRNGPPKVASDGTPSGTGRGARRAC